MRRERRLKQSPVNNAIVLIAIWVSHLFQTRTRTNTNPYATKAGASGKSGGLSIRLDFELATLRGRWESRSPDSKQGPSSLSEMTALNRGYPTTAFFCFQWA